MRSILTRRSKEARTKRILQSRPSPALVLSLLALFIALGGVTYAAAVPRDSVGTAQLKRGAVRNGDIIRGAVSSGKLRSGAVTHGKLAADAVTGDKVRDGSLTGADLVLSTLGTVPRAETANMATTATTATTATSVAPNGVNTAAIQHDAVTSAKIAANAVGAAKMADDAVTSPKIAADAVGAGEIAADAVGAGEIAADAVGAGELKGTYAAVSGGTPAAANAYVDATATCNPGDRVLGGGFAWLNDADEIETVYSTPDPLTNPNTWVVRSRSGAANTLFAWAVCLAA